MPSFSGAGRIIQERGKTRNNLKFKLGKENGKENRKQKKKVQYILLFTVKGNKPTLVRATLLSI